MSELPDPQSWAESRARNAILLERVYPPRYDIRPTSYFGGVPTLPVSVPWPIDRQSGEAMSFLGQIDCSRLPEVPGEAALPPDGVLYFFARLGDGTAECRVLYSEHGQASGLEARRPDNLAPNPAGGAGNHVPAGALDGIFPKWAVEPIIRKTYPGEAVAESFYYEASGRVDGDPFIYATACSAAEQENLREKYGAPIDWTWPKLPYSELWWPDDAFPYAWMQAVACAEKLLETLDRSTAGDAAPGQGSIAVSARLWIERGREAGLYAGVPGDMRREFRAWIESVASGLDKPARGLTLSAINSSIFVALEETCDLCLAHSQDTAALIPAEIVTMQRYRHACFATFRGYSRNQLHQMLGHGKGVQAAPETHKDDVLLMQFDTDAGMHWMWGDTGVLQFWITPDDLRSAQFDGVVMTVDCH